MSLATLLFWGVCLFTVTGASVCVFARKLLHAAFGLGLTLLGIAALYLFLQAEYLAAVQLLVYVGGVLTLVIFGVQLSSDPQTTQPESRTPARHWIMGGCGAALIMLGVVQLAARTVTYAEAMDARTAQVKLQNAHLDDGRMEPLNVVRSSPASYQSLLQGPVGGNTGSLGDQLLGAYLLPFLALAILLTAVLIGAVALARDPVRGPGLGKGLPNE